MFWDAAFTPGARSLLNLDIKEYNQRKNIVNQKLLSLAGNDRILESGIDPLLQLEHACQRLCQHVIRGSNYQDKKGFSKEFFKYFNSIIPVIMAIPAIIMVPIRDDCIEKEDFFIRSERGRISISSKYNYQLYQSYLNNKDKDRFFRTEFRRQYTAGCPMLFITKQMKEIITISLERFYDLHTEFG